MIVDSPVVSHRVPSLGELSAVFAKDANLTFGGGSATAETLRREIVVRRGWLEESEFRLAYAASRLTPATNLLAVCTALGWQLRRSVGALLALLSSSVPSAVIVAVVMALYPSVAGHKSVAAATRGAIAVSVALLLSSVWSLAHPHLSKGRARAVILILGSWWAYVWLGWSALTVLILAAAISTAWPETKQS